MKLIDYFQCIKDEKLFEKSIHFVEIPKPEENLIDEKIVSDFEKMQTIIEIARKLREKKNISLKSPIMVIK